MQIFALDKNPVLAAFMLHDCHATKMLTESVQILSTVARQNGFADSFLYKETHINHPCVKWAGYSSANYEWLIKYSCALADRYTQRHFLLVSHKSYDNCLAFFLKDECKFANNVMSKLPVQNNNPTRPPLCFDDEYKHINNLVTDSYMNFYRKTKLFTKPKDLTKMRWLGRWNDIYSLVVKPPQPQFDYIGIIPTWIINEHPGKILNKKYLCSANVRQNLSKLPIIEIISLGEQTYVGDPNLYENLYQTAITFLDIKLQHKFVCYTQAYVDYLQEQYMYRRIVA